MFEPEKIEKVVKQMQDSMPKAVKDLGSDIESKIKQGLQHQLSKLDVVTREEFDIQTQVLLRTRQKLSDLEEKIDELLNDNKDHQESDKAD